MKFSDFKSVEDVIAKYPLARKNERFLPDVSLDPPNWFIDDLDFILSKQSSVESEMYYREGLIFPFMRFIWKKHPRLKVWINRNLAYGDELHGEPDYFISQDVETVSSDIVGKSLLAVAEAKQENFIKGWGQCLAEMIACQKINGDDAIVVYGIVSTGMVWEFGKLSGSTFTRHIAPYTIHQPSAVLGVLDYLFAECERQIGDVT